MMPATEGRTGRGGCEGDAVRARELALATLLGRSLFVSECADRTLFAERVDRLP